MFKIGDKVIVSSKESTASKNYDGKTVTITKSYENCSDAEYEGKKCGGGFHNDELTLVKKKDVMKLKAGDKVRYVGPKGERSWTQGKTYTLREYDGYPDRLGVVADDQGDINGWDAKYFEAVDLDELDKLIEQANIGAIATYKLWAKHRSDIMVVNKKDVEVKYGANDAKDPVTLYGNASAAFNDGQHRYAKKKAKKFESFILGNSRHNVDVKDDNLSVGCQKDLGAKGIQRCLRDLIVGNSSSSGILSATCNGVRLGSHILPWADAKELYAALVKFSKE